MNCRLMLNAAVLCILLAGPNPASAQTVKDLAGTWTMVSNVNGGKTDLFGAHGTGQAIFSSDGHFVGNPRMGHPCPGLIGREKQLEESFKVLGAASEPN